jgi:hypothetical protein
LRQAIPSVESVSDIRDRRRAGIHELPNGADGVYGPVPKAIDTAVRVSTLSWTYAVIAGALWWLVLFAMVTEYFADKSDRAPRASHNDAAPSIVVFLTLIAVNPR